MKFFLSLILLLLHCLCISQNTFFKQIDCPFSLVFSNVIETDKGEFILALTEEDLEGGQLKGSLIKTDIYGNLINIFYVDENNVSSIRTISKSITKGYLIGGYIDSLSNGSLQHHQFIKEIDSDLNINYSISFPSYSKNDHFRKVKALSDSLVYLIVNGNTGQYTSIHKYNRYTGYDCSYNICAKLMSASDIIYNAKNDRFYTFYYGHTELNKEESKINVLELDSNMEYVSCMPVQAKINNYCYAKGITDSSYILCSQGRTADITNPPYSINSIHLYEINYSKTDTIKGTQIYPKVNPEDTVLYSFMLNNVAVNENKIAVGGIYNIDIAQPWYNMNKPTRVQLSIFDRELNLEKQIYYGDDQTTLYGNDIQPTKDGGFILCGLCRPMGERKFNLFLLKVNSEGLITGMDEPQGISASEAVVYPNPGGQRFKVKLAMQHQNALLEMFSMNGKLVLRKEINQQQTEINTQTLPQGCYTYRITAEGRKIAGGKWVKE